MNTQLVEYYGMLSGGLLRFYFTKIVGESAGLDYWGSYKEGEEGWDLQQPALNLGGPHAFLHCA